MSDDPRAKAVPSDWAGPLSLWCTWLAAAGRSRETVGLRRAHVAQLARGVGGSPSALTADELLAWLAGREWRRETRRAVRSSLRGFFAHAGRADLVAELPVAPADVPVPRPTPDDVVDAARAAADDRQLVILRLAAEAGLRRGEIAVVHADDLSRDLLGWTLLVHGKGGKRRPVPLSDDLATMVRLWCGGGWLLPGRIAMGTCPRGASASSRLRCCPGCGRRTRCAIGSLRELTTVPATSWPSRGSWGTRRWRRRNATLLPTPRGCGPLRKPQRNAGSRWRRVRGMVCERCGVDVDAGACECEVLEARRTVCVDAGRGCEVGCDGAVCASLFVGAVGGAHER